MENIYLVLSSISILGFLLTLKSRKSAYQIALMLAVTLILSYSIEKSTGYILLLGLFGLFIVHITVVSVVELKSIFVTLPAGKSIAVLFVSIIKWTPLLLIAMISLLLIQKRDDVAWKSLYEVQDKNLRGCRGQLYLCETKGQTDKQNVLDTVDHINQSAIEYYSVQLTEKTAESRSIANQSAGGAKEFLFDGKNALFKPKLPPSLRPPSCSGIVDWISKLGDCIKRQVLKPINVSYETERSKYRQRTIEEINRRESEFNEKTISVEIYAESFIQQELGEYSAKTKIGIERLFGISKIISVLSKLLILLALIKGLLHILARHIFSNDSDTNSSMRLGEGGSDFSLSDKVCDITNKSDGHGSSFKVKIQNQDWFVSYSGGLHADTIGKTFPRRLLQCFIARALASKLTFHKFDAQSKISFFKGSANHSTRFIKVILDEGDQVSIKMSSLVGYTDKVRFHTMFNATLAAFLQYRLFYSVVEGPGTIIVKADGGTAEICPPKLEETIGFSPLDLLVIDMNGRYFLNSHNDLWNLYFGDYNLAPDTKSLLIKHAPTRGLDSAIRIYRKILFFILPI